MVEVSEVGFMWNLQMQCILGRLLRSLFRNPWNFSGLAPEVRPAAYGCSLSDSSWDWTAWEHTGPWLRIMAYINEGSAMLGPALTYICHTRNGIMPLSKNMHRGVGTSIPKKLAKTSLHLNEIARPLRVIVEEHGRHNPNESVFGNSTWCARVS